MLLPQKILQAASTSSVLLMLGCADYTTGQLEEPQGPIEVLRLTLFDANPRYSPAYNPAGVVAGPGCSVVEKAVADGKSFEQLQVCPVFTDTSLPDCKPVEQKMVDCTNAEMADTLLCRICYKDVFKDINSKLKSPPTPDSGQDIRVVWNKVPFLFDGKDIGNEYDPITDKDTTDLEKQNLLHAVNLTCANCAGLPPLKKYLLISGSDVSYDPTSIPYGPSFRLALDQRVRNPAVSDPNDASYTLVDPRVALEPGSKYAVQVDTRVSGRDGISRFQGSPQARELLSFETEPFKALRVGRGEKTDQYLYAETQVANYALAEQPLDAALVIQFNASIYPVDLGTVAVTAIKTPGNIAVPVKLGTNVYRPKKDKTCPQDNQRNLYVYPDAATWPADAAQLDIRIPGGSVADVAQGGAFERGKHSIGGDIVITVKFPATPKMGGSGYTKISDAAIAGKCS